MMQRFENAKQEYKINPLSEADYKRNCIRLIDQLNEMEKPKKMNFVSGKVLTTALRAKADISKLIAYPLATRRICVKKSLKRPKPPL